MTLEQSTQRILAAAEAQDLALLEAAGRMREEAIAALASAPPTPVLRSALEGSIVAGEEARRAIRAIKQRIRGESRRLANIEKGFVRALRPGAEHRVDCQG
jgi:hypothetical protein